MTCDGCSYVQTPGCRWRYDWLLQGRAGTRTRRRAPRKRWAIAGWRTPSSNTARKKASRVDESAIRSAHCVSLVRRTFKFVYCCPLMAGYRSGRSRAVCFGLFRKYWSAVSTAWSTRASRFWRRALPPNLKSSTSFGVLLWHVYVHVILVMDSWIFAGRNLLMHQNPWCSCFNNTVLWTARQVVRTCMWT